MGGGDSEDEFRERRRGRGRRRAGGRGRGEGGPGGAQQGRGSPPPPAPAPEARASPPPEVPVRCQLCRQDLSGLDPLGREQHVNRCLDDLEGLPRPPPLLPPPPPPALECPVCGKGFGSVRARAGHLKRCAARMQVPAALLLQALRRQRQQPQPPPAAHAPAASPSLASPGQSRPPGPRSLKRKGASAAQQVAKKPKAAPKTAGADEDLLVAMAMSRSLLEKEKSTAKRRAKERKRRAKPPSSPPALLLQDAQKMRRDMEARVGQLLLSEASEFPSTPRLPSSRLWETERSRKAGGEPASPQGPSTLLWDFSSLTGPCGPGSFSAAGLLRPVPSQLPGTQGTDCRALGAGPCQSGGDGEPQDGGDRERQDAQALRDLEELAGEGLTLTQWGLELRQLEEAGQEEERAGVVRSGSVSSEENRLTPRSHHPTDPLGSLARAFREMVNNPHLSDLQLQVHSGEILYAHMFVLYARCPQLMEEVERVGFLVAEEGGAWTRRMLLSDAPREAVESLLSYLYTADPSVPPQALPEVGALAARFGLPELAALCGGARPCSEGAGEETEGGDGDGEGRARVLDELLGSVWLDDDDDHEGQPKGAGAEEAGGENMSEQDLEEIYRFAATQHRLAAGPAEESRGPREGQRSPPGGRAGGTGASSPEGATEGDGGAGPGPPGLLASDGEADWNRSLCLDLSPEAEGGPAQATAEESREGEGCLLGLEGRSPPSQEDPGSQEPSPTLGGTGSAAGHSPCFQEPWALALGDGAPELLPGLALSPRGPGRPSSPPPRAACAREPPGTPSRRPAPSPLPPVSQRHSPPRSRSTPEELGRGVPSRAPEDPQGEAGALAAGAPGCPVVVVVLDSEEEEEEEEAEQAEGSQEPCKLQASLEKRPAVWGLSSEEEEEEVPSDEGLTLVPDTPGPCRLRAAWGASGSGPDEPWDAEGEAGPFPASSSPLGPLARGVSSQDRLPLCTPGNVNPSRSLTKDQADSSVVLLEDSEEEEEEEEEAEAEVATVLSLDEEASSPSSVPAGAAVGTRGLRAPSPASEGREGSPGNGWMDSPEDGGQGWAGSGSDSSDFLPLGQSARSPPAGAPSEAVDPSSGPTEGPSRTSPQTPMPSYSTMVTPELKKELRRFGVRALPKRQMVLKLREIFQFTHPPRGGEGSPGPPQAPPCTQASDARKALAQAAGSARPPCRSQGSLLGLGGVEDPRPGRQGGPGQRHWQDGPGAPSSSAAGPPLGSGTRNSQAPVASESSSLTTWEAEAAAAAAGPARAGERLPTRQAAGPKTDPLEAVGSYLRATPALRRQVLLYQPIELAGLQAELKAKGIRIALGKLLDFLDAHGITFTTAEARREKRTPQKGRRRC